MRQVWNEQIKAAAGLRNPKSVSIISRQLSMNFEFGINGYDRFLKDFQFVVTIMARTAEIGPRSSKNPPDKVYFQRGERKTQV